MKRSSILLSVVMVAAFVLAACATPATPAPTQVPPTPAPTATEPPMEATDIVDTAIGAGSFGTLVAAVQAASQVLKRTIAKRAPRGTPFDDPWGSPAQISSAYGKSDLASRPK